MDLKMINKKFAICKVNEINADMLNQEFTFVARTNEELSLLCEEDRLPDDCIVVEKGWCCFRIAEDAAFEKYGMIAYLADIIAAQKTSTLVVGTFDTDYIFIKQEKIEEVKAALIKNGSRFL